MNLDKLITNFNEMITWEDQTKDSYRILKLSEVQIGEYFSGVVYVTHTTHRRNNDGETYDLTFHCIDGNGIRFMIKMFGAEKFDVSKEIILIKKGQSVLSNYGNKVFYNASAIVRYKDVKIPITEFIKSIPDVNKLILDFDTYTFMLRSTEYKFLYEDLNETYNFKDTFSKSQYTQTMGTSLGSPLYVYRQMMEIYKSLNSFESKDNQNRYELFNIATLIYILNNILKNNNNQTSSENIDILSMTYCDPKIISSISKSSISELDKAVLLSIVQDGAKEYSKNKFPNGNNTLCTEFYRILLLVEEKLNTNELIRYSNGKNKLPNGNIII